MDDRQFKDALYEQFARIGHALSTPKRLEILDLLEPCAVLRIPSPEVRMPTQLVSTLLQGSQQGCVGPRKPPVLTLQLTDLFVGPQEPSEHGLPTRGVRQSAHRTLDGGNALGHAPPREAPGRNTVEESLAVGIDVAADDYVDRAQGTPVISPWKLGAGSRRMLVLRRRTITTDYRGLSRRSRRGSGLRCRPPGPRGRDERRTSPWI